MMEQVRQNTGKVSTVKQIRPVLLSRASSPATVATATNSREVSAHGRDPSQLIPDRSGAVSRRALCDSARCMHIPHPHYLRRAAASSPPNRRSTPGRVPETEWRVHLLRYRTGCKKAKRNNACKRRGHCMPTRRQPTNNQSSGRSLFAA